MRVYRDSVKEEEEEIPLWGRICAIADVFDALTSERPYKQAFPEEKALSVMQEDRGKHFDPELLDLFTDRFDRVIEIHRVFSGNGI